MPDPFLIIVGPFNEAVNAVRKHGVSEGATFQVNHKWEREIFCWAPKAGWKALSDWFLKDVQQPAPFPPGTLLWYTLPEEAGSCN